MQFTQIKQTNRFIPNNKLSYFNIGLLILDREKRPMHIKEIALTAIRESFASSFKSDARKIELTLKANFSQYVKYNIENPKIRRVAPSTYQFISINPRYNNLKNYIIKLSPQWLYSFINQYLRQLQSDSRVNFLGKTLLFLRNHDSSFLTTIYQSSTKIIDNSINMNDLAIICRYYAINNDKMLNLVIDKLMESEDFIEFIENYKENNK